MTQSSSVDPEVESLMPETGSVYTQMALVGASVLAIAGLAGVALVQVPALAGGGLAIVGEQPLLIASLLAFAAGAGGVALVFNVYFDVVSTRIASKIGGVYISLMCLLTAFVSAGTFNLELALLTIWLVCVQGVAFSLVAKGRVQFN
jgi:hypothetical protein